MSQILLGFFAVFFCLTCWAKVILHNKFVGVSGRKLQNVVTRLQLDQKTLGKKLDRDVAQRFIDQTPQEINRALQPFGYFRSQIKSQIAKRDRDWYATYYVNLGPVLHITSLDLKVLGQAAKDTLFKKYLAKFPIKKGDAFNSSEYKQAKQKLFNLASRRGYLAAAMQKNRVRIDLKRYTCSIIIYFDSGHRYYFGSSYFPKSPFSESFLMRFIRYKKGDYYSEKKLQKTQQDFNDSGLFQGVVADPKLIKAKNLHVPITYHLLSLKSQRYAFGAGFGTDTGLRGLVGIDLHNLTKTAHHARLTVKGAQKQAALEGAYVIPGRNPATDRYDLTVAGGYEKQKHGKSYTLKLAPAYITTFYGWQQTLKLNLQREWFKVNSEHSQVLTLLYPSGNWIRSKGNDPIRPTKGYRIAFLLQGAQKNILSQISFVQTDAQLKIIQPLYKKRTLLVLRGEAGYTWVDNSSKLPLTLRFTAGGAQSIRGYSYQAIGPGNQIGIGSIELRQQVVKHWYGALFYDAGYVADKYLRNFRQSIGVGIVWLSPVGAIQLSYGQPLRHRHVLGMIQFSMGPEL